MPAATLLRPSGYGAVGCSLVCGRGGRISLGAHTAAPSRVHAAKEMTMLRIDNTSTLIVIRERLIVPRVCEDEGEANAHSLSSPERVTAHPPPEIATHAPSRQRADIRSCRDELLRSAEPVLGVGFFAACADFAGSPPSPGLHTCFLNWTRSQPSDRRYLTPECPRIARQSWEHSTKGSCMDSIKALFTAVGSGDRRPQWSRGSRGPFRFGQSIVAQGHGGPGRPNTTNPTSVRGRLRRLLRCALDFVCGPEEEERQGATVTCSVSIGRATRADSASQ